MMGDAAHPLRLSLGNNQEASVIIKDEAGRTLVEVMMIDRPQ